LPFRHYFPLLAIGGRLFSVSDPFKCTFGLIKENTLSVELRGTDIGRKCKGK